MYRRNVAFARFCGFFSALVFLGCSGSNEKVIKIGFVAPLTSDQAAQGLHMLHGAELAVEQANAAGPVVPGYQIELVPLDDQHNPTQAVSAAKKLVSDPDVVAVVGHLNSSCTKPAGAIYYQARMLQVTPISTNPEISRQGFDTFYRACATDDLQGRAGAKFAFQTLGLRKAYVIDDMTTYGRGLANEFKRAFNSLGGEVVSHEGISQGEKDFTPLLTKVKAIRPDLVYYAGMFPEGSLMIKQRYELGIQSKFIGGDGLLETILIQLATPQAAEGIYVSSITVDPYRLPSAQEFVRTYEARYGQIGAYTAYSYEATNIVLWAIRKAAKKDRQAVLASMKQLKDYSGILGVTNFDQKGDSLNRTISIFQVKNGKFEFVTSMPVE